MEAIAGGVRRAGGPIKVEADIAYKADKLTSWFPMSKQFGDLDNILKSILDALNGVAYNDDYQVVSIEASRRWAIEGEKPGVTVTIWSGIGGGPHGKVHREVLPEVQVPGIQVQVRRIKYPKGQAPVPSVRPPHPGSGS